MNQLNLGLASYGIALALHRLGDRPLFSWILVGFTLLAVAIVFVKFENGENAIDNQLNLVLALVSFLFGGVMSWL